MNHDAWHFLISGYRGLNKTYQWHCRCLVLSAIILFQSSGPVYAQDIGDLMKAANDYYEKEQFHSAAQYYQVAIGLGDADPETTYRLAQSYRAIFNYSMAARYYRETMELNIAEYPLSSFYLAQMQKSMGNFKKASDGFDSFINNDSNNHALSKKDRLKFIQQAEIEKEACLWAIEQLGKRWTEMGFGILPEPVNSSSNDYAAVSSVDGSVITITSGKSDARGGLVDNRFGEHFTDNFRYKNLGEQWVQQSSADHFDRTNTKFSDGVGAYNDLGDKYYFTSCYEGNAYCKLYVTYLESGVWKNPELLNENVNAPGYDNKHPTLTRGGDTLIFVSNRPGGKGGNDLWFSVSLNGEAWEKPQPLPGDINTPFNEASPFCSQGNLLFFSSDGHPGIGGMDIFMAKNYQSSNSTIQNLGTPFNSGYDDSFFSLGEAKGYLSSNRPNGYGKFDIYHFNIPTAKTDLANYLQESAEGTQLRSRIRANDGSNLYAARDEDQFYYDNLTAEERARLDRIIEQKKTIDDPFDPKLLSREDFRYYKKLDIETKATIERLAHKRARELEGIGSESQMTPQQKLDWEYYQNISPSEKEIIDRIIDLKVEIRRHAIARLSSSEQQYIANQSNQERIEDKVQLRSLDSLAESLSNQQRTANSKLVGISQNNTSPTLTPEAVQQRSAGYMTLIEKLGLDHRLHYQAMAPEERDNVHRSAVRQAIVDNPNLTPDRRTEILVALGLEQDPLETVPGSANEPQTSLDIRQALTGHLINEGTEDDPQVYATRLARELDLQQSMFQNHVKLLSLKEQNTRKLREQLIQVIDEQESAPDPQLEQKIVDQFYSYETRLLPLLSPKESYYFNALTPGQQLRLDRLAALVNIQTQPLEKNSDSSKSYITDLTPTDQWFYRELPAREQEILDSMVTRDSSSNTLPITQEQEFLKQLDGFERDRVTRIVNGQEKLNLEVLESSSLTAESHQPKNTTNTKHYENSVSDYRNNENSSSSVEEMEHSAAQIYFDFDSHTLRAEAKMALEDLVLFLSQQQKPVKVVIEGHTDSIGDFVYNDNLGNRRSISAASFIQPSSDLIKLTTKSYGERQPTSDNSTPVGRQINRRVELKIQGVPYKSPMRTYLVRPNVTMAMIVDKTRIPEEKIMEWNGLDDNILRAYQPLRLPMELDYQSIRNLLFYPNEYQAIEETGEYHTVEVGDSLFKLAERYGTSVQVLEDLNDMDAADLLSGQKIRIR